jgi:Staphylococcal nuclease homologue
MTERLHSSDEKRRAICQTRSHLNKASQGQTLVTATLCRHFPKIPESVHDCIFDHHGIDAPEKGQAFSNRAKQYVSDLVFGKEVAVRVGGQDRYGRIIGEVFLADGRYVNHEIVGAGFAWWFRRYAPDDRTLAKLESEAREARRGLWADRDPMPPWEFRKVSRTALGR